MNDTAPIVIYSLALHDALPISSFTVNVPVSAGYGGFYWDGTGAAPSFLNDGAVVVGSNGTRPKPRVPLTNHGSLTVQSGSVDLGILYGSVSRRAFVGGGSIVGQ